MGTNFNGWGYPPSQTLSISSRLSGIAVDVDLTSASGSTTSAAFAKIRGDLSLLTLVFKLPFDDEDDLGADSSKFGLRRCMTVDIDRVVEEKSPRGS